MSRRPPLPATLFAACALAGCGLDVAEDALLVGHRGDPFLAIENSLASFDLAYAHGADGVEFDVQLTRDGRNVVMHDDTLDRTTSCAGPVRDYTVDELRGCTLLNGEPVVLLEEMLRDISGLFRIVFVEIKVPEEPKPPEEEILVQADDAVATVLASGFSERIVLISYDGTALQRVAERRAEGVVAGWDDFSTDGISKAHRFDMGWVLMPLRTAEPWVGDIVHGLGLALAVYDVSTPGDLVAAMDARAHAIMVDSVGPFALILGREQREPPVR